jgi:hypothetical protein
MMVAALSWSMRSQQGAVPVPARSPPKLGAVPMLPSGEMSAVAVVESLG